MTRRQAAITSLLPKCRTLADVGCDHGYFTKYALDNGLCEFAFFSDVSAKSLHKAEVLLKEETAAGRCASIACDGLTGYPYVPECVLIAGMGGEEIVKILSPVQLPEFFLLQPMKNADKVRRFLLSRGVTVTADFLVQDGKFYEIIAGRGWGTDTYTEREILFGRDNLHAPSRDFYEMLLREQTKLRAIATRELSLKARREVDEKRKRIEELANEIAKNL